MPTESPLPRARRPGAPTGVPSLAPAVEAALDALRVDPQRSRAALLCVAAGMAVIVSLVSIVSGGRREMLRAVEAAGPANVFLRAAGTRRLTTSDLGSSRSRVPSLEAATGVAVSAHDLSAGSVQDRVPVHAAGAGVAQVFPLRAASGRLLGELDFRGRARTALVGSALARRLGPGLLGRRLDVGTETYEVVGVLMPLASDAGGAGDLVGLDWDRGLLVPLGAEPGGGAAPDEDYPIDVGVLRFPSPGEAARAARLLGLLCAESGEPWIRVTTPSQALDQHRAAHRSFDRVALLVSILSTASAAFGITNLLRASVRARAAEIGLRRAVGARREDVRAQFLMEGLLLGLLGGLGGVGLGVLTSVLLLSRAGWRPAFEPLSLALLTLGSGLFGIAAGLRPAAEAAGLDPGVALRIE